MAGSPIRTNNFEYWKTGVFHFCVQDPDVEGLAAKIIENGGKQRMPVREYYPGEKPYRIRNSSFSYGPIFIAHHFHRSCLRHRTPGFCSRQVEAKSMNKSKKYRFNP